MLYLNIDIVGSRGLGTLSRIAIQFYSDDDFERLYELLVRAGKA